MGHAYRLLINEAVSRCPALIAIKYRGQRRSELGSVRDGLLMGCDEWMMEKRL